MERRKRPVWLAGVYVLIMAMGFSFMDGGWPVPWYLKYVMQSLVPLLAFGWLIYSGDFFRLSCIGTYFGMNLIPYIGIIAVSVFYWLLDLQTMAFISRGCSTVLYLVISLLAVSSAVYLFGRNAAEYTLYSMVLANTGMVLYVGKQYGIQTLLSGLVLLARSGGAETTPAVKALEVHDLTFAFGLYLVYYLAVEKDRKRRLLLIPVVLFFLLGFKRIALLGILGTLLFHLLLSKFPDKWQPYLIRLFAAAAIGVCLFYVFFIRSSLFNTVVDYFGIDTMGRRQIFDFFKPFYEFSPSYRGKGIGFVSRYCNLMSAQRVGVFKSFAYGGMHNDIVAFYIEMGFWGFVLWLWYTLYFRIMWISGRYGLKAARILLYGTVYMFITYATDNTFFYCYVNTIFMLLPMAYAVGQQEIGEKENHQEE